jgi:hypothetical protein
MATATATATANLKSNLEGVAETSWRPTGKLYAYAPSFPEEEEEITCLPWRGRFGRATAGCARAAAALRC